MNVSFKTWMQRFQRKETLYFALGIGIALGIFWFWPGKEQPAPPPKAYESVRLGPQDVVKTVSLPCFVRPDKHTTFTALKAGFLKVIHVQEGEPVTAGQILAEMENDAYQKSYEYHKNKVELYEKAYARQQKLSKTKAGSSKALETAGHNLLKAQIDFEESRQDLDERRFIAPFDGICGVFLKKLGQPISEGDAVVSVSDPTPLRLQIPVPVSILEKVGKGSPIVCAGIAGTLSAVQKTADPETGMGFATATYESLPNIVPGTHTMVQLEVERRKSVVSIPRQAVFLKEGKPHAIKIVDGKAQETPVVLGLEGDTLVEIKEGLKSDDILVILGQENLNTGDPVTPLFKEAASR